jgi:ketosteroid isomerase-like protein
MKRLVLLAIALILSSSSVAQENPANSDEIQIRQLERAWNQAEANQQVKEVSNLVDDTLVYTDYDGSLMNKAEYMKWVAAPEQKADHLFDEGMTVHVYANAAVVSGIYRESGTNKGKKYVIRSRYTDTWIRYGTIWRCVASHSTLVPNK